MRQIIVLTTLLTVVGCGGSGTDGSGSSVHAGTDGESEDATGRPQECGPDSPTGLEVGMCAPEFELPDADGVMVKLSSFRGKVALVDISALW